MVRNIGVSVASPRKACEDDFCPFHGTLSVRGKLLTGTVASAQAPKMVVVSREYPGRVAKYKRFQRSKSKVHAYLPSCLEVKEGEEVRIAECRRLAKTVSFVVIEVNTKDGGRS
ncbi:MAG TPA: 30S ribosomal protein S17 [Nitrososphaera sp.]|jgi:small subunit ribosomal protein S17|nr:30S ribosomal protein S17 [Thermoproteota archaeon]HEU0143770.1 30S ribosomal protein S17 [Nitrososphaera sp.]